MANFTFQILKKILEGKFSKNKAHFYIEIRNAKFTIHKEDMNLKFFEKTFNGTLAEQKSMHQRFRIHLMLFYPVKVPLKVFSSLFKIFSAYCEM